MNDLTFEVTVKLNDDRNWSDTQIEEVYEELSEAGVNEDDLETYLQDILNNVVMRSDIGILVRQDPTAVLPPLHLKRFEVVVAGIAEDRRAWDFIPDAIEELIESYGGRIVEIS